MNLLPLPPVLPFRLCCLCRLYCLCRICYLCRINCNRNPAFLFFHRLSLPFSLLSYLLRPINCRILPYIFSFCFPSSLYLLSFFQQSFTSPSILPRYRLAPHALQEFLPSYSKPIPISFLPAFHPSSPLSNSSLILRTGSVRDTYFPKPLY